MIGSSISHFEIQAKIGEGGMGVVYRARDTRLDRSVALKLIREDALADSEFLKRFRREAKVLASLNHPGIAAIHDVGEHKKQPFLALEFVDGETLAARLANGALSVDETMRVMLDVADALAAAHDHGVIHRDLKPANLMLTPDGHVKILDFGLARRLPIAGADAVDTAASTVTAMTESGRLLGTAGYMSPEQARGEPVDSRSDIWAFGCIMFECLTGCRAFPGRVLSDCIAAVLLSEPDWSCLPPDLPPRLRLILERCLRKDRRRRYHAIADIAIELEDGFRQSDAVEAEPRTPGTRRVRARWPIALALLLGIAAGPFVANFLDQSEPDHALPLEFAVPASDDVRVDTRGGAPLALSRDGRRLAFCGTHDGVSRLYYFELGRPEAVPLPDTEGATVPFFSPDGEWIAFFSRGELRKISLADGRVMTICAVPATWDLFGSWSDDGVILFGGWGKAGNMRRVPAAGGEPRVQELVGDHGRCIAPSFLPGGNQALVLTTKGQSMDDYWLAVLDVESGVIHPLREFTSVRSMVESICPQYLESGHIVFADDGVIRVVPFDHETLAITGEPTVNSRRLTRTIPAFVAVASSGSIAYLLEAGADDEASLSHYRNLVWVDREGGVEPIAIELGGRPMYPVINPDGRHLSVTVRGTERRRCWSADLDRMILTPLTEGQNDHVGLWSRDGSRMVFSSDRDGPSNLYVTSGAWQDEPRRITRSPSHQCPSSWTPDGRSIVYVEFTQETDADIWIVEPDQPDAARPLLATGAMETHGMVSPDGRWLAYTSEHSGRREVYVDSFDDLGIPIQVSIGGGQSPIWDPEGDRLYFLQQVRERPAAVPVFAAMEATITAEGELTIGEPRQMFSGPFYHATSARPQWDITPDGSRFVMIESSSVEISAGDIRVVMNWDERLR
jgi:serine/threonine protein kinase/Tol biopolymer transport system component